MIEREDVVTTQHEAIPGLAFWLESDSQKACEIAKIAGFDTVVFDMEHGVIDELLLDRLIPFCNALGLATYVRVSEATQPRVQIALDIGATGVILPQIRDLSHAMAVTPFAKYPPLGLRGMGYSRTLGYGSPTEEYVASENRNRLCYVMIETPGALADAGGIAALDCVDGLFVGPSDLSLTSGRGPFRAAEPDMADLARIARSAKSAGKRWAAAAGNAAYRKRALALAPNFVTAADDLSALLVGFRILREQAL
jgi:4-hydroxy-2-oxoheptanedioate aldolase